MFEVENLNNESNVVEAVLIRTNAKNLAPVSQKECLTPERGKGLEIMFIIIKY